MTKKIGETKYLSDAEQFEVQVISKKTKPHKHSKLKPGKFYSIRTHFNNYLTIDKNGSIFTEEVSEKFKPEQKFFVVENKNNMILLRNCYGKYLSPNQDGSFTCVELEKAEGFEVVSVVDFISKFKKFNSFGHLTGYDKSESGNKQREERRNAVSPI